MERAEARESFEEEKARRFKELDDFLAKWKDLPGQRTTQWYLDRTFSVGASEIPTLYGTLIKKKVNPYQTIKTLVGTKAGLIVITDKTAMNWGCVMEYVVTMLTEKIFDCEIREMGSVPTARMRGQRSSPDGVAVVPCLGNKIVSFEFKAPKNRIPKGSVPAYYRPQVLTCLCAVEPSDLGIFVDCVIRKCSVAQWTFWSEDYDYDYHREIELGHPLAMAALYFYDNTPDVVCETLSGLLPPDQIAAVNDYIAPSAQVDLGACDPPTMEDYFARVCAHDLRVKYSRIFTKEDGQPDWYAEAAKHPGAVALLPIKIMRCVVCPVKKEPDYILQFQPLVDQIVAAVHTILDAPEAERASVYHRVCDYHGWTEMPYGH